jgi:transposase
MLSIRIYKPVILQFVSYESETGFSTEGRTQMSDKISLNILLYEQLHALYKTPGIVRRVK